MLKYILGSLLTILGISTYSLFSQPQVEELAFSRDADAIERGRYLISAGGCVSCHQDPEVGASLSGGHALSSDFGTFYVPNITPDLETGIGGWTAMEFLLAVKKGRRSDGGFYFPAFPYRAYAGLADQDVLDMGSYLMALEPVSHIVPEHELPGWIFNWMMAGWNFLAALLDPPASAFSDSQLARGAYLARNLGHCGECHTPRNAIGIPKVALEFAGATLGDSHADAIDSAALRGWSLDDFAFFLFLGMKPDEEYVGGEMESVIAHNTSQLTDEDRQAMAAFFKRDGPH